ncbi:hypothetical protein RhiirA1_479062 [Rhizophagus irregularis]|uniref:Uncharacterized protein n=1 Tax=Rhizophagus irregularis TaxID=588596 RepID=A0A2N0QR91_9GLOM|nr:hypothetical protein RhiirA1_479062 [Rhizophagus irregularis]
MTSSEPLENLRKGRHFTEDGKPHVLREHLENHCRKCLQEVSLQFAKIVGNEIAENEDDDESDSELTTKKQRLNDGQTSI